MSFDPDCDQCWQCPCGDTYCGWVNDCGHTDTPTCPTCCDYWGHAA